MGKRCVIISGGEYSCIEVEAGDFVIACDRGYEYAAKNNIVPALVVGDFDSFSGNIRDGVAVLKQKREKDDTDTMTAVRYALREGYNDIRLYCALGGRLDHLYANLQAAGYAAQKGAQCMIKDECTVIVFIKNGLLRLPRLDGFSVSLFSFTSVSEGVTTAGLKYPLFNATLENTFPWGASNEWTAEEATVTVQDGILMAIMSKLI